MKGDATTAVRTDSKGNFVRQSAQFRSKIDVVETEADVAEAKGRYHLYLSWACPWAHRTLIQKRLRKLDDFITVDFVDYFRDEKGWKFTDRPGCTSDRIHGATYIQEIYEKADPDYSVRATVPVLWDKKAHRLLNNESLDILRMFEVEGALLGDRNVNLYPEALRIEIDVVTEKLYERVNNGVYRCGFAQTQETYDEAVKRLFEALDEFEEVLVRSRYLCGDQMTLADICFYVTLIRFDCVYYSHFKCNLRRISDYPNIWNYLRDLYRIPAFGKSTNFDHIKGHYFETHKWLNPSGIVPKGPILVFD